MAPKRASTTPRSSGRGSRGPKAARVDETFRPVFDLLPLLEGATDSATDMMGASLPHALGTPKEDRHAFQSRMIDAFWGMVVKTEAAREEDITQAEAAITKHQAEQGTASARLETATETEGKLHAERQAANESRHAAAQSLRSAGENLRNEERTKGGMDKHVAVLTDAKEEFETDVAEAWIPARDGVFAPKEWRRRQKAVTRVVACLMTAHAPESLRICVQTLLNDKAEYRTPFGCRAVEHCEASLGGFVEGSQDEIARHQVAIETQSQVVSRAADAVASEATRVEAQTEVQIAAENRWCDAATASKEIKDSIKRAEHVSAELRANLEATREALAELNGFSAKFVLLRDAEATAPTTTPAPQ